MTALPARRFHARKNTIDGSGDILGIVTGLTLEECKDTARFPYGVCVDEASGRKYVWGEALMYKYC